ncbi:phosphate ABC transporter substrate-binding protein [Roseivivax halodurans JCM 10272]|uniref:Phosphate ABC transporter substrate-binding protein n=1 Tax=Roseivivax halodurans JCM 10272 TaxID=1449350 RepID=X7ECJ1_9RHOB|nr:substrate-binding domain-containing protein [Roseivivax halodurans]ETX12833.1 phosphate ABC transporter substrate-binding protein [Roseivivax halodurans JCM 10272]
MKMTTLTAVALVIPAAAFAQSRENIRVVGSSTVYPFTTAVAENFARESDFPPPVVESTGTGGGFQIFCEGIGAGTPDINDASRAMASSEEEMCAGNGVESVTEIQIGNDGIVLAMDGGQEQFSVTPAELFQALAAETVQDGEIVDNPYQNWSDINSDFPEQEIVVFGPPTTSGTRDAFVELAMETGCEEFEAVTSLEEERMSEVCTSMRSDGGFVEAGENDNVIVQRLSSQPGSVGIFGYSYYDQNTSSLTALSVNDAQPTAENIAAEDYPLSRPLFIYVKDQHVGVIPGLAEFLEYYTSDAAWGPDGFLVEQGLIPMAEERRSEVSETVAALGSSN